MTMQPRSTPPPAMTLGPTSDHESGVHAVVGERLTLAAFSQLEGTLGGYSFVKVVVDRPAGTVHFLNHDQYAFHADYIAERILGISRAQLEQDLDGYNKSFYFDPDRRFYLGILSLHARTDKGQERRFLSLETVEIDNMDAEKIRFLYRFVKDHVDPALPVFFKPANHPQETLIAAIAATELPRVSAHELFATAPFVPLNLGTARGRLRAFKSEGDYRAAAATLEWHDVIVMARVPDDIPRVSGIINAEHTTPLSHTNVLASGWQIPNAIQLGIFERIDREKLDGQWVEYRVDADSTEIDLRVIERPREIDQRPAWSVQRITLEAPETVHSPIVDLDDLRMSDRYRYGTKAANLGELRYVLRHGSERLTGFYKVRRPPRSNLLPYLASYLRVAEKDVARAAWQFLRSTLQIPRGIAIPFAIQQQFLEASPRIQQAIGKLKMALELDAREVDALCLSLQQMIRATRMPEAMRNHIDAQIADRLGGVSSFVVRSSSNAEDLAGFSAAGIYESINHVTTAENIFEGIKEVWSSLLSPRSVRLRQQVGISLDDCYMGVVVQEEVPSEMGGVLVTTNPMNRAGDFRNVYINVSPRSVTDVVTGAARPMQYLYNTVEGAGRTLSLGDAPADLPPARKDLLMKLAFAGRLLQSHFSPDYTFNSPVDIEWTANGDGLFILQLRPYAK